MPKVGFKMSEESKQKMREAKLRNPVRYWKGKKISQEHNEKMQAGKKLKAPTPRLGRSFTKESRQKISQTLKNKYASGELQSPLVTMGIVGKSGKEAPNWQGGKSLLGQNLRKTKAYKDWHAEVLKRDDYTCQYCKKVGGKLQVDHVKQFSEFPDQRLRKENGLTLCEECHKKVTFSYKLGKKKDGDLRVPFIDTLIEMASKDPRICLVICDVGFKHADRFQEKFPDRYFNFGITESSSMIICAAMALSGLKPYFYSMVNFSIFRPLEMVRNAVCYHNADVKIIGVSGSEAYAFLGLSHNTIHGEDVDALAYFPNIRIYTPKTVKETEELVRRTAQLSFPAYIRL